MICPKCGKDDQQKVLDTRKRNCDYILRRRECVCGYRFSTVEIAELNERSIKSVERIMRKSFNKRAFAKIIDETYRRIFDKYQWSKEKRSGAA